MEKKITKRKKAAIKEKDNTPHLEDKWDESTWWCLLDQKMKPLPDSQLEKMARALIEWSHKSTSLKITGFYTSYGLTADDFYDYCDRYKPLERAHRYAMEKIGARREELALLGEINPHIVMRTMPLYDKKFKEMREWEAKLRQHEDNQSQTKVVVIERFPSTDIVPDKTSSSDEL